ncbi:hypothetical protein GUJ93_ZPchr0006g42609 [Zizania palustris]|uniref:Uncharacterized protein n=1 Tax=Zizania palustris TaxID=103762 RepID=A0A8J5SW11_ZIZPA|nr:hypothetical protein GUJ93_ZPchr0006g42609 [Zizania palustris]
MAAASWLRRAAAVASAPRLPSGFPLLTTPPPAPLAESQSLVLPGLGAAVSGSMELMAVPKKKVSSLLFSSPLLFPFMSRGIGLLSALPCYGHGDPCRCCDVVHRAL